MKIRIANSAGFCYGVRRAVELAEGAARSGEPCVMLGPIIHNQDMMDHLARHGLRAVVRPEEVPEGSEVIIRSHGESRAVHEGLHARGVRILDATCPNVTRIHQIVARAEPDIERAIAALAAGEAFAPPRNNLYDRVVSGPVNPVFYALVVKDRAFAAGAACTGCGRCAQLCPTNNIVLRSGKPVWGGNCTHCMACISYCPTEAIEYGKKSVGKPRYRLEAL